LRKRFRSWNVLCFTVELRCGVGAGRLGGSDGLMMVASVRCCTAVAIRPKIDFFFCGRRGRELLSRGEEFESFGDIGGRCGSVSGSCRVGVVGLRMFLRALEEDEGLPELLVLVRLGVLGEEGQGEEEGGRGRSAERGKGSREGELSEDTARTDMVVIG
jgi:hypothetical protein